MICSACFGTYVDDLGVCKACGKQVYLPENFFQGETIPDLIPGKLCFGVFSKEDGSNMDLDDVQVRMLHQLLAARNVQPHMHVGFTGFKTLQDGIAIQNVWRKDMDDATE